MNYQQFCPECLELKEFNEVYRKETFNVKQEKIIVNSRYLKCTECLEEILVPGEEDENFSKAYDMYREKKNLLFPEEIKIVREKYGLSQRMLAKILGWGHATLSRYETGALQSISHNNELVLIKEPENMLKLLETNKGNLSIDEYNEVRKKIIATIDSKEDRIYKMIEEMHHLHAINWNEDNILKFYVSKTTKKKLIETAKQEGLSESEFVKECFVRGLEYSTMKNPLLEFLREILQSEINISINQKVTKRIPRIIKPSKRRYEIWEEKSLSPNYPNFQIPLKEESFDE